MSFIRRLFRVDPRIELIKGRKAFGQRNYKSALKSFEKAFKHINAADVDRRILCLDNAALSAEKVPLFEKTSELYFQLILLKLAHKTGRPSKLVMVDIDRAIAAVRASARPAIPVNKLLFMKFLIFLAENDLNKLVQYYKKLEIRSNDEYGDVFDRTWDLIHASDTFVKKKQLPSIDLPKEFLPVRQEAEQIMQRLSLCQVTLLQFDDSQLLEKGSPFSISGSFTSHAELTIVSISLRVGSRGRIVSSTQPELPLTLREGASQSLQFSLIPNLPGTWIVGPLSVVYSIPSDQNQDQKYSVVSKTVVMSVKEAVPALRLSIAAETIEKDYEYRITINAENVGKTTLQELKITTEIPDGVEISEGTEEKFIGVLGQGELFQYELRLVLAVDRTHFDGHIVKAAGSIQNQRLAKCSLKISGR